MIARFAAFFVQAIYVHDCQFAPFFSYSKATPLPMP